MSPRRQLPAMAEVLARLGEGPRYDDAAQQGPDLSQGSTSGPPGLGPVPVRTREPGGTLVADLQPPAVVTLEQFFQKLPESGMFDANLGPGRNFPFQIGAYKVPQGQVLWLYDYEFWVNRLSGIDAGDAMRAEQGRYVDIIGFDINVNGSRRPGSLRFELDPTAVEIPKPQYAASRGAPTVVSGQAQSFASVSGVGASLLPVRSEVQGPRDEPFTWVVAEGDIVVLAAVVFRPFKTPIGSIGGRLAGYLFPAQVSDALIRRSRLQ